MAHSLSGFKTRYDVLHEFAELDPKDFEDLLDKAEGKSIGDFTPHIMAIKKSQVLSESKALVIPSHRASFSKQYICSPSVKFPVGLKFRKQLIQPITDQEKIVLYEAGRFTIDNIVAEIPKFQQPNRRILSQYLLDILEMNAESEQKMPKVTRRKNFINVLKVEGLAARNLFSKDGFIRRHPICELYLERDVLTDDSTEFEPSHKLTQPKKNTLNPLWNETFLFDLAKIEECSFHINIWDSNVRERAIIQKVGTSDLAKIFMIRKSGVFLGCVDISLSEIPSTGLDQWFILERRYITDHVRGDLYMKFSWMTRPIGDINELSHFTNINLYETLMKLMLRKHFMKLHETKPIEEWDGTLGKEAVTLLYQFSLQSSMSQFQQYKSRWKTYVTYHIANDPIIPKVHCDVFYNILIQLEEVYSLALAPGANQFYSAETEGVKYEPAGYKFEGIFKIFGATFAVKEVYDSTYEDSFMMFIQDLSPKIINHREIFKPEDTENFEKYETLLKCLNLINEMQVISDSEFHQNYILLQIETFLKQGNWQLYYNIKNNLPAVEYSNEIEKLKQSMENFTVLLDALETDLQTCLQVYNPLFMRTLNIDYFYLSFQHFKDLLTYDLKMIVETVTRILTNAMEDESQTLEMKSLSDSCLQLFVSIRNFASYMKKFSISDYSYKEKHQLENFPYLNWGFPHILDYWVKSLGQTFLKDIDNLIIFLENSLVEKPVQSTTVTLTAAQSQISDKVEEQMIHDIFNQIVLLYTTLDWPSTKEKVGLTNRLIKILYTGIKKFVNAIKEKELGKNLNRSHTQVKLQSGQVILQCSFHVLQFAKEFYNSLSIDELIKTASKINGVRSSQKWNTTLLNNLNKTIALIEICYSELIDESIEQVKPKVEELIRDYFMVTKKKNKALMLQLQELFNNIKQLYLKDTEIYNHILLALWKLLIKEMKTKTFIMQLEEKRLNKLKNMFQLIEKWFKDKILGGANGDLLNTAECKELKQCFELLSQTIPEQINQVYIDRLNEQERIISDKSVLIVKGHYDLPKKELRIYVVSAKNLSISATDASFGTFITAELIPEHYFGRFNCHITTIRSMGYNPNFNQYLSLNIELSQLQTPLALVEFIITSGHKYKTLGFCYLNLHELTANLQQDNKILQPNRKNILKVIQNLKQINQYLHQDNILQDSENLHQAYANVLQDGGKILIKQRKLQIFMPSETSDLESAAIIVLKHQALTDSSAEHFLLKAGILDSEKKPGYEYIVQKAKRPLEYFTTFKYLLQNLDFLNKHKT